MQLQKLTHTQRICAQPQTPQCSSAALHVENHFWRSVAVVLGLSAATDLLPAVGVSGVPPASLCSWSTLSVGWKATGDTGCPAAAISLEIAVRHFVAGRKRVRRCSSKASGDWLQLNGNVSAAPKLHISLKIVAAVCSSLLLPSLLQEAWLHHITTFWREGRRYPSWEAHSLHFFLQRRKGWSSVIL